MMSQKNAFKKFKANRTHTKNTTQTLNLKYTTFHLYHPTLLLHHLARH